VHIPKLVVALGRKLTEEGELDERFKHQIARAAQECGRTSSWLLITGGPTRPGFHPESIVAAQELDHDLRRYRTMLETQSRTTVQNIKLARELIESEGVTFDEIVFIAADFHVPRVRWVCNRHWQNILPKAVFIPVGTATNWEMLVEAFAFCLCKADPNETWLFPRLAREFRNA
jgi:uncharacterized SAM-binding protein YcdF (DUF218 family)